MQSQLHVQQPNFIERPPCPNCGRQMRIARIVPDMADYDKRSFECPECQHDQTLVVQFS
jgi:hypothetical protein